ncbi:MAG: RnfABCDGE type electron transport complex subunit D [Planctomycetes bacterium]|nr:RnfABCDGE type electron transport complex subunit D [Planctomycetota bacterium]
MSAEEKLLFNINNSPHIRDADSTPRIMYTVCLALAPALVWSLLIFGWRVLVPIAASTAACLVTESLCCWWRGKPNSISDGSALVTGLLIAAVSPPNLPWWAATVGGVFAIGIAKQAFGGLGHNIWNPALLARAFMSVSMPDRMMSGEWPHLGLSAWYKNIFFDLGGTFEEIGSWVRSLTDAVITADSATASHAGVDIMTGATALARMHNAAAREVIDAAGGMTYLPPESLTPSWQEIFRAWLGNEGGSIGEISVILVILGGVFLIFRKIVNWDIPVFFIGAVAVLGFVIPHPYKIGDLYVYTGWFQGPWLMHLGSGGLMLGAFFMATDMVTMPLTPAGRRIFAIGCGGMTILIRLFAGYPEGVCYAILFMNTCVPFIDIVTRPKVFGKTKR